MNIGDVHKIRLGYYEDKYLVTSNFNGEIILRRVQLPKTKIDGVRLPEILSISVPVYSHTTKKTKLNNHKK